MNNFPKHDETVTGKFGKVIVPEEDPKETYNGRYDTQYIPIDEEDSAGTTVIRSCD